MALETDTFVSTGATLAVGSNIIFDSVTVGGTTGKVEVIKLADGTAGSSAMIIGSSGSALDGFGLQVNVVNSSKTPIGVVLTGGQSSVTVSGSVTVVTSQSTSPVSSGNALGGPGLQVNVVNSSAFPIGVVLTGGQSSVSITGNVTLNALSTTSKLQVELSTTLGGFSSVSPLFVVDKPWSLIGPSTWCAIKVTSTALATMFSSAASTRYNVTDISMMNSGAAEVSAVVYDGSTSGTVLFRGELSSAGGGFVQTFSVPRRGSSGNPIVVEVIPASTVFINAGAFKTA